MWCVVDGGHLSQKSMVNILFLLLQREIDLFLCVSVMIGVLIDVWGDLMVQKTIRR